MGQDLSKLIEREDPPREQKLRVPAGGGGACSECPSRSLRCGEKADSSLSEGDCRLTDGTFLELWSFEVVAAGEVKISLKSRTDALDPYLFLVEEASCLVLDENDDCEGTDLLRSCLSVMLQPGKYLAAANSYSLAGGDYEVELDCPSSLPVFHRGDVDGNAVLEITDPVNLLSFLFLGGAAPKCLDASDADDSGELDITDAVLLLSFQFLGGPPPAPPGPPPQPCGVDPAPGDKGTDLGCGEPDSC